MTEYRELLLKLKYLQQVGDELLRVHPTEPSDLELWGREENAVWWARYESDSRRWADNNLFRYTHWFARVSSMTWNIILESDDLFHEFEMRKDEVKTCDKSNIEFLQNLLVAAIDHAELKIIEEGGRETEIPSGLTITSTEKSSQLKQSEGSTKAAIRSTPRVFIGSSSEGLDVAHAIQAGLDKIAETYVWDQGTVFTPGSSTIEALEKALDDYDFGIFVFTPDAVMTCKARQEEKAVVRENVTFECGLFFGRLGRTRTFVVHPQSEKIDLFSDFDGMTTIPYNDEHSALQAGVGSACTKIREAIKTHGVREN